MLVAAFHVSDQRLPVLLGRRELAEQQPDSHDRRDDQARHDKQLHNELCRRWFDGWQKFSSGRQLSVVGVLDRFGSHLVSSGQGTDWRMEKLSAHFPLSQFQVGFDHHLRQFSERNFWLPAQDSTSLAGVAAQNIDFRWAKKPRVLFDVLAPIRPKRHGKSRPEIRGSCASRRSRPRSRRVEPVASSATSPRHSLPRNPNPAASPNCRATVCLAGRA